MYSTTPNKVTFFISEEQRSKSTDKCVYATVSEAVKDDRAERGIRYDNWNARFVGNAVEKAKTLADKSFIEVTKWNTANEYVRPAEGEDKGHKVVYMLVYDFNIVDKDKDKDNAEQ